MDIKIYEDKMEKSLANLEDEYTSIRAGRANPRILDITELCHLFRVWQMFLYRKPV